jgi:hypothetical protein
MLPQRFPMLFIEGTSIAGFKPGDERETIVPERKSPTFKAA